MTEKDMAQQERSVQPVRIGLVAPVQSAWEEWHWTCLSRMINSQDFEIVFVMSLQVASTRVKSKTATPLDKLFFSGLKAYETFRDKKEQILSSAEKEALLDTLFSIPVIDWSYDLRPMACDILVSFFNRKLINQAVCLRAQLPLLFLIHGDPALYDGSIPGFWEVCHQDDVTSCALICFNPGPDRHHKSIHKSLVAQAFYSTAQRWFLNAQRIKNFSVTLLCDELKKFQKTGDLKSSPLPDAFFFRKSSHPRAQDSLSCLKHVCAHDLQTLTGRYRKPAQWRLLFGKGDPTEASFQDLAIISPPETEYWADPFLWPGETEESCYVFFENDSFLKPKGKISVGKMEQGQFSFLGDALVRPYHLSFPFLFEEEGQIFMIPETHQSQKIEIWKCDEFPFRWSLHRTLLDGQSCVDTSLIKHQGGWWLITNISRGHFQDHQSELHIFRSSSLNFEDLEPHALNPVCRDVRFARNGGRILERNGQLFRFAQNNSRRYGYGLSLMQIDVLTPDHYEEKAVYTIPHHFYEHIEAIHHCDVRGDFFIFDGLFPSSA